MVDSPTPSGGSGQSLVNQSLIKALRERAAQHQSLGPGTGRSSEIKAKLTMVSMDGPAEDRLPVDEVKHVEIVRSSTEHTLATSPETVITTRIQRDCQARFHHDGQMKKNQHAQKTFPSQGTFISASTPAPAFSSLRAAASSDLMACVGFSILRVTSKAHEEKGSRFYIANVTLGSDAHGKQLATGMRIKAVNNFDVSHRRGDEVTRLLIGAAGSLSQIRVAAFESSGRPSEDRLVEVAHDCAVPEADSLASAELKRESTPTARTQVQGSREHGPGGAEVEEGEGKMRELIEVLAHERSVRKMTMAEDMIKAPSHHACDADEDKNGDDSLARGFDAARPRAFSRRCPKVAGGHRVGDRVVCIEAPSRAAVRAGLRRGASGLVIGGLEDGLNSLKAASFEASPALDASDTLLVRFDGLGVFQMHARQHVRRLLFQDFTPSAEASMEPRLPA